MKLNSLDIPFVKNWLAGNETFIFQTSGSTGSPQAIVVTRKQIEASVRATQKALHLTSEDTALICLPTQYTAGLMMLARCLIIGMEAVVVNPSGNPFEQLSAEIQPTFMAVVPLQLQHLLQKETYFDKLNRMKAILVGGAPVSETLAKTTQKLSVPIWATYGMTETVSHIALRKLNGSDASNTYTVLPDINIKVNAQTNCLEICGAVTNYQWVYTRDIVQLSDDGKRFTILGRIDNIINSGGIKIQPESIEEHIQSFFKERYPTMLITVSSVPDEILGEKLVLVIEKKYQSVLIEEEIFSYLKNTLPIYQVPKKIIYIDDLPKTQTDKINRKLLKKMISH